MVDVANNDAMWDKHFDAAGIEREDNTSNEGNDDGNNSAEQGEGEDSQAEGGEGKGEQDQGNTEASADKGDSNGGKPNDGKQQPPKQDGKAKEGQSRDPKGGKGLSADARSYRDQLHVEKQRVADYSNQLKQMRESRDRERSKAQEMERTVQSVNGANPTHVALGVRIVRDMQTDPVGTLRKLLTEAVANGHTIEGIGQGIDAAAITRLIESRMPQAPAAQQEDTAAQEVQSFYQQYPDARVHDATLARVLHDHPQLSLADAMFELKSKFAEQGLDWSRDLNDPVNRAIHSPSRGQDTTGNGNKTQQKPMPNGRQGTQPKPADHIAVASETTSTEDIIRQAMRENGLGG